MTNRKWLLEQNEYDLLMRVNEFLNTYVTRCALEPVATDHWYEKNGASNCNHDCKACIQKWLNEERR